MIPTGLHGIHSLSTFYLISTLSFVGLHFYILTNLRYHGRYKAEEIPLS